MIKLISLQNCTEKSSSSNLTLLVSEDVLSVREVVTPSQRFLAICRSCPPFHQQPVSRCVFTCNFIHTLQAEHMVSLSLKAAPEPSVLIFSIQYINSARIQTQSSLHQPFPWLPCMLVDTDGCCVSTQHQVHVQPTCGILGSPHIPALQPGVRVCGCTYAFHWGTWQGCMGQRRRLKWEPKFWAEDW